MELRRIPGQEQGRGVIRVKLTGRGSHRLLLRASNLDPESAGGLVAAREVDLKNGASQTVEWTLRVLNPKVPWVAVVLPDGNWDSRQELTSLEPGQ